MQAIHQGHRWVLQVAEHRHQSGRLQLATAVNQSVREMMHLSLSFDHRVIDGQVGAAFTYELIRYMERPELLFMELT